MSDHERLTTIQSYVWTLELLGEALVQHDEVLECEYNPQLSFRNTAGIHRAIRIISRLASEQFGELEAMKEEGERWRRGAGAAEALNPRHKKRRPLGVFLLGFGGAGGI